MLLCNNQWTFACCQTDLLPALLLYPLPSGPDVVYPDCSNIHGTAWLHPGSLMAHICDLELAALLRLITQSAMLIYPSLNSPATAHGCVSRISSRRADLASSS